LLEKYISLTGEHCFEGVKKLFQTGEELIKISS